MDVLRPRPRRPLPPDGRRPRHGVAGLLAGALLVGGCGASEPATPVPTGVVPPSTPQAAQTPSSSPDATPPPPEPVVAGVPADEAEVVAGDLPLPWSVAALPDGSALVSLRDEARVVRVSPDGDVVDVATTSPDGSFGGAAPAGEGGLLGLALSPGFAEDGLVYAYVTRADDNAVVRAVLDGDSLGEPEVLLEGVPRARVHNGGRVAFGPDGMLYVTTGDARDPVLAQDPDSLAGKVLRLAPDGAPAPGNPEEGSPVWTLGHRNVQGLGWDAQGRLYATEFGADTWDELNLLTAGANYGWPEVEGPGGDDAARQGFTDPVAWWSPAQASPSGLAVVRDAVWVSALRGERLWRVPVETSPAGGAVGQPEAHLVGEHGRLRDVSPAPGGGALWVLTNDGDGEDELLRVPLA
ncbi:sorbosone dehydrogenase family protein [uncultured Pseudokineococcus sp.]|uniref:PQQ-dependent sugar dehydrogenase n=1 Tax=uncultured Pseudokineococcus sp. TaxID=1642928 RepID=UPI002610ED6B|nr:PQQ-dependent sugar dehydrogenase [uncultured Pseudokineococcus sp.]